MEFKNEYKSSRNGFSHFSRLFIEGQEISQAKAHYLNRTWEEYAFQSVMKQAVRNAIEGEISREKEIKQIKRLTKKVRETIETESTLIQQLKDKLKTL
jgi:hypothetical protein